MNPVIKNVSMKLLHLSLNFIYHWNAGYNKRSKEYVRHSPNIKEW